MSVTPQILIKTTDLAAHKACKRMYRFIKKHSSQQPPTHAECFADEASQWFVSWCIHPAQPIHKQ